MKLSGKQKYLSLSIILSYSWSEWVIYRMYRRRCQPVFILTLFLIFDTLKIPKASPCWLQKGRMYNRVNKKNLTLIVKNATPSRKPESIIYYCLPQKFKYPYSKFLLFVPPLLLNSLINLNSHVSM